jgi:Flp pilus assembly protein TadD
MSQPTHPALQRAILLQRSGDTAGAAAIYRQLLRSAPGDPQLLFLLGSAEQQLGRQDEAATLLRQSLHLRPNQPSALCNLGVALFELGRYDEALASYDRALALNPNYAMAYNNRGNALVALGRREEALDSFARALAVEPRYADAHNNRGGALREKRDLENALAAFDRAIALAPGFAMAHLNRGTTLNELCRPDEALASFDHALTLNANQAAAHCGRATALFALKRFAEAEASNQRSIALAPELAEAHWNRALFRLIAGDLAEGWEDFEWRFKLDEWHRALHYGAEDSRQRLWTGDQPIAGKTLLVRPEQGYGDFVQFARYIPMLRSLGANTIVETLPRLVPLLATLDCDATIIEAGRPLPPFDLFCPIMSLPRAFRTRLETVPAKVPYLFADPQKQSRCLERLGGKTAPRIGLVWSGSPKHPADRLRSVALQSLEPVLRQPLEFHALQKDISLTDAALMSAFRIRPHDEEQDDFSDAAALIACMDLVVTVDTAVVHIAGAMGAPVWVMLSWMADWRWLLDRADSPWYPTATLFRQKERGDWAGAVEALATQLRRRDFRAETR